MIQHQRLSLRATDRDWSAEDYTAKYLPLFDMDIPEHVSFNVGGWQVSPDEDTVSRDGHSERLEPLAMQVLVYLASRAGEVVSRTDLEQSVWRGVIVGYDAVTS